MEPPAPGSAPAPLRGHQHPTAGGARTGCSARGRHRPRWSQTGRHLSVQAQGSAPHRPSQQGAGHATGGRARGELRPGQAARLRNGQVPRPGPRRAGPCRGCVQHAPLFVARTGPGAARRPAERHLLPGRRFLRDGHRERPVRRRIIARHPQGTRLGSGDRAQPPRPRGRHPYAHRRIDPEVPEEEPDPKVR